MLLDANLVTVLVLIGLTVVVGAMLGALSSRWRGACGRIFDFVATVWILAGLTLLALLGSAALRASHAFHYDTPQGLIRTMRDAGTAQVVLDPGRQIHNDSGSLLRVQRRLDIPYIALAFTASSGGGTLPDADTSTDIYALYDPGKNHCDRREYRGQATEVCRDFGSALTFRLTDTIEREQR